MNGAGMPLFKTAFVGELIPNGSEMRTI